MTIPLTTRQRMAQGQLQRKRMKRVALAEWNAKDRKTDAQTLLAASMEGRVKSLIPIKYDRMAASPFGYFRGAVPVMAYDLSLRGNTAIPSQLCGDAHVRNLGAFGAPDGRLVFDINDFDETIAGPFEWDVKRMAASLILAGRETGAKNLHCREAAGVFLERYRTMMHAFTQMAVLEVARFQVRRLHSNAPVAEIMQVAERATPMHTLQSLTVAQGGAPARSAETSHSELPLRTEAKARIFKTMEPDLTPVDGATARQVLDALPTYAESLLPERQRLLAKYRALDVAFKLVGTGSVGLRDYCVYMQGNGAKDPLFLQIKEEARSAYAPYVGQTPNSYHEGRRVVEGQRAMQLQSDPFLGWTTIEGRDYLVRQLNDHKASVEMDELKSAGLLEYASVCGEILARGHARSSDCAGIAGYVGTSARFDEAVGDFAVEYADQTEADWQALVDSRKPVKTRVKAKVAKKVAAKKKAAG